MPRQREHSCGRIQRVALTLLSLGLAALPQTAGAAELLARLRPDAAGSGLAGLEGAGTTVALIDSGLDLRQPALAANLWRNGRERPDGVDNDGNGLVDDLVGWDFARERPQVQDRLGHGTEMAGLILQGAPDARLMVLKVFDASRRVEGRTIARAIDYAAAHGAQVINLSLISQRHDPLVAAAIGRALQRGLQVVAAAGNQGRSAPLFPARLPGVLAVAATTRSGQRQSWSNGGSGKHGEVLGVNTEGLSIPGLGGSLRPVDGTSAAAALVSGHLARLGSRLRPELAVRELLQAEPSVSAIN